MKYISYIIGIVFVASGILKSVNIDSFTQEVQQYIDLYMLDYIYGWSRGIAMLYVHWNCWLEF